jgi:serpin B
MAKKDSFAFAQSPDWKALRLPYKGGQVAMLVVLPADQHGLKDFEFEVTPELIGKIRNSLQHQEVDVKIPKFTIEDSFTLSKALRAMGMPLAFSQEADFSGMTASEQLAISEVIHKAYIEVDEEGTEAAAATAVVMRMTAMRPDPEPKTFHATRPFLFIIEDTTSGMPYFMGRVMMPGK